MTNPTRDPPARSPRPFADVPGYLQNSGSGYLTFCWASTTIVPWTLAPAVELDEAPLDAEELLSFLVRAPLGCKFELRRMHGARVPRPNYTPACVAVGE